MSPKRTALIIRPAETQDFPRLATLCEQLGYPSSLEQVQQRLGTILNDRNHILYIAQTEAGEIVGWAHAFIRDLLVIDRHIELGGLVVDEQHHGLGVGRQLIEAVESWALAQRCPMVYVRSNIMRTGAHQFYERLGYQQLKTSLTFRKLVTPSST